MANEVVKEAKHSCVCGKTFATPSGLWKHSRSGVCNQGGSTLAVDDDDDDVTDVPVVPPKARVRKSYTGIER
jgi:hypothetical protein